eukprot:s1567_g4.t1
MREREQELQSTLALELSGSLCSLIFDPVGSGYDWLQDLHTQRNPAARGGTGDRAQPSFEEEDDEKEETCVTDHMLDCPIRTGKICHRQSPPTRTACSPWIIRLEDLSPLHGFVGTLLVLLSGASTQAQLSTESLSVRFFLAQRFARAVTIPATADVSTSSNPAEVLEAEELCPGCTSLLQG